MIWGSDDGRLGVRKGGAYGGHLGFLMFISHPFEELEGWNLEFKRITPKSITGTYFDTKLSRFGLAGSAMAALIELWMFIFQLFE